jgi:hypothetical protein
MDKDRDNIHQSLASLFAKLTGENPFSHIFSLHLLLFSLTESGYWLSVMLQRFSD